MAPKRIGELLLERGAITQAQLETGLVAQKRTRQRLGVTLVQQGVLSEVQLAQTLAQSLSLGTVDLNQLQADWSAVHMLRARFCETHELFPFALEGKGTPQRQLLVAMSDPLNRPAIEEIEFTTGLKVAAYVSTHSQVRSAILRYYHKGAGAEAMKGRPLFPTPTSSSDELPIVGEEIRSGPHAIPARSKADSVARDLEFLFGGAAEDDGEVETLERRFWALLRILQRKGLLTREEFLNELEQERER